MKRAQNNSHGSALIVVLACLVMITGLVIAFLVSMQSRLVISRLDYASGEAGLLADAAVNVVVGQIQNATQSASADGYAWASQPGMVRTYGANGELVTAYKLYSAENMVTDQVDPAAELAALANWDEQPALFTDLNAPRNGIYPIVDPSAAGGVDPVAGFTLSPPPGGSTNSAPMPGRWLYLLQDGTLVAPLPGANNETAVIPGASATNAIVGRLAFWTDDETSRVNINTAAGDDATEPGSFWDSPFYDGTFERGLATKQPSNGEYQRYPGHPATVSLSTVFPQLTREEIYRIAPRIADGGSRGGTVETKTVTDADAPRSSLDEDRLYASVDELVFEPGRTENAPLTNADLRRKRFFLTATSRASELTLFGTPRISLWPVHADLSTNPVSPFTSAYDRLAAFCSTFGGSSAPDGTPREPFRYYFQRKNADSPTEDANTERNEQLYSYLQNLTSRSVPGFGGNFLAKYPVPSGGPASDRDQILTQAFDYIRSTNLFDTSLGGDYAVGLNTTAGDSEGRHHVYPAEDSSLNIYQFTDPHRRTRYAWPGHAQVAPMGIGNTKGFGRFYGVTEVAVHLICTAEGGGLHPDAAGSAYDHRTISNLTADRFLKNSSGQDVGWTDLTSPPTSTRFRGNRTLGATPTGARTALLAGQKRVQAVLLVKVATPSHGFPVIYPDLLIHASGLENLNIGGQNPFPAASAGYLRIFGRMTGGTDTGLGSWMHFMNRTQLSASNVSTRYAPRWDPILPANANISPPTFSTGGSAFGVNYGDFIYQWVSDPFTVGSPSESVSFGNPDADITVKIYAGNGTRPEGNKSPPPATDGDAGLAALNLTPDSLVQTLRLRFPATTIPTPDLLQWSYSRSDIPNTTEGQKVHTYWGFPARFAQFTGSAGLDWASQTPGVANPQGQGSFMRIAPVWSGPWKLNISDRVWPAADYSEANSFPSDVVRSLIVKEGDIRLALGRRVINHSDGIMVPHPDYDKSSVKLAHSLANSSVKSNSGTPGNFKEGKLVQSVDYYSRSQFPNVPPGITSAQDTGDWDNGLGPARDGAYINMPDEGMFFHRTGEIPYYVQDSDETVVSPAQFSPNRIVHSAGQFGSLPTGVHSKTPWQTLLFRPQPGHRQSAQSRPGQPPDHLFMDLFTMPTVEPYAVSEPFSTAGKVNMNYQILPYTYIHRSTALQSALKGERLTAVPTGAGPNYKRDVAGNDFRLPLNLDIQQGTLRQFEEKFRAGDIFRSATEICDIYLTPEGSVWSSDAAADAFWNTHRLTGDNARERPYAKLYAKLTTRSNSYQVYYRVQALQQPPNTPPGQWNELRGRITSEQRGSAIIERYLDPNDNTLPDHATAPSAASLDSLYRFRILAKESFAY